MAEWNEDTEDQSSNVTSNFESRENQMYACR